MELLVIICVTSSIWWNGVLAETTAASTALCKPLARQFDFSLAQSIFQEIGDNNFVEVSPQQLIAAQPVGTIYWITCSNGKHFSQSCISSGIVNEKTFWAPLNSCLQPPPCPPFEGEIIDEFDNVTAVAKFDGASGWNVLSLEALELASEQPIGTVFTVKCNNGKRYQQSCVADADSSDSMSSNWNPQDGCSKERKQWKTCAPLGETPLMNTPDVVSVSKYDLATPGGWLTLSVNTSANMLLLEQPIGAFFAITCESGQILHRLCISVTNSEMPQWSPEDTCSNDIYCPPLSTQVATNEILSIEKNTGENWTYVPIGSYELNFQPQPLGTDYWISCTNGETFSQHCERTNYNLPASWSHRDGCSEIAACPALTEKVPLTELQMVEKLDITNSWRYYAIDWDEVAKSQPIGTEYYVTCNSSRQLSLHCRLFNEQSPAAWYPEPNCTPLMCPSLLSQLKLDGVETVSRFTGTDLEEILLDSAELTSQQLPGTEYRIICSNGKRFLIQCSVMHGNFAYWDSATNCSDFLPCPPIKGEVEFADIQFVEVLGDTMSRYVALDSPELSQPQPIGTGYWFGCKNGNYFYRICEYYQNSFTKGFWNPQNGNCSALFCLSVNDNLLDVNTSAVEKYDAKFNQWMYIRAGSVEAVENQPYGTELWVGCSNGATYIQTCSLSYDGTAKWYSQNNCSNAKLNNYLPLSIPLLSEPTNTSVACPALIRQSDFAEEVLAVETYDYSLRRWHRPRNMSTDLSIAQPFGAYYWIGCRNGKSFTLGCEGHNSKNGTIGVWSSYETCEDIQREDKTSTCQALTNQLPFDGIASVEEYNIHRWSHIELKSWLLSHPRRIGTYVWIGCKNGGAFTLRCGRFNGGDQLPKWLPQRLTCSDIVSTSLQKNMTDGTCPALNGSLLFDGVVSLESYNASSATWTNVSLVTAANENAAGSYLWIGCSNGASFMQRCDTVTKSWEPKQSCFNADHIYGFFDVSITTTPMLINAALQSKTQTPTSGQYVLYRVYSQIRVKDTKASFKNPTFDENSDSYNILKQSLADQLALIYTMAGFLCSPTTDINITSLRPIADEIHANHTSVLILKVSEGQELDASTVKAKLDGVVSLLRKDGAFANFFGSDGPTFSDISDFVTVAWRSTGNRNIVDHWLTSSLLAFVTLLMQYMMQFNW